LNSKTGETKYELKNRGNTREKNKKKQEKKEPTFHPAQPRSALKFGCPSSSEAAGLPSVSFGNKKRGDSRSSKTEISRERNTKK
jgi:hypothetical protein